MKTHRPVILARRALIALAAASSLVAPWAQVHAAAAASPDETANCIAVMQSHADGLARQIKAGDRAQEAALHAELRRAGALIGRTYLDGLRDGNEAKARLQAAQERQTSWDEERKHRLHLACLKRADAELSSASGIERYFVERFAQARLGRMLGPR